MVIHFIYLFVRTLNVLPFIKRVRVVHFAIAPICIYILSLIFNWKLPMKCLAAHFLRAPEASPLADFAPSHMFE
jgi:hypothetical protein